ncbi:MAG: acetyl ornithine aminotransferase family protein [Thermoplasmata archaeon]|nr:acetyl ornithine aminotransferase family protein [Thermoplasmata archaeon]MCI4337969.1 acetyl ornithine aminotransferase family protein [Thermoplasmata archaeon]MCI4341099.1 acetyl ornithine aminotransferase family protein [Thermoplasmata archaeon]
MSETTTAPVPSANLSAGSHPARGVRIVTPIPGPNALRMVAEDTRLLMTSTKSAPIAAESARGVWIHDVDGNTILDFTSGVGVLNVGHSHPDVVRAVQQQAAKLMHFAGTDYYYDVQVKLAQRLTEITPGNFGKKVFFTNSGTESIEAAVKLARYNRQKSITIGLLGAFHGRTMGALTLTSSKSTQRERFGAYVGGGHHIPSPYCYRCPYQLTYPSCDLYCAKILKELYFETSIPPEDVAAFVAEPVLGEGGYIVPPPGWHAAIKRILDEHQILFISDEVQAGIGRTGRWFGVEHHGVVPDIIASAKALGGGLPMGAIIFRKELDYPHQGAHSNTFGGNLVAGAAALASLEVMEREHLLENARKGGEHLQARLRELQRKHPVIGDVRGLGLMVATEFIRGGSDKTPAVELRDRIIEESYQRGLLMLPCGKSSIRHIPPLVITTEELDEGVEILDAAITAAVRAG